MPAKGQWLEYQRQRNGKKRIDSADPNHFCLDVTIGSVHYQDAQRQWQEIDNEFVPAVAPWNWEMTKANYQVKVKNDFTAGQIIQFEKQGETLQFQPMALEWTNDLDQIQPIAMPNAVSPVVTNPVVDLLPEVGVPSHQGTIRWDNGYGSGKHFEWKCTPSRLTKILQIDSLADLPAPEQYIIDGGHPVLRLNLIFDPSNGCDIYVDNQVWDKSSKTQTFNIIEFRKDGEVLWGFMPLRYWDSDGNEGQSVATLEKRGNSLYISIRVPYSWLQTAVYPVYIDTDVDEQVGASTDDCRVEDDGYSSGFPVADGIDLTNQYHSIGWTTKAYGVGDRFTTVSVPQGPTVDVAYTTYKCRSGSGTSGIVIAIYVEDSDDAATFSTVADYNGRSRTALVQWSPGDTTTDVSYNSPSLVTPFQTLFDRVGWATGQSLVVFTEIHEDTVFDKTFAVYSYDRNSGEGTSIHIEYTAGGGVGGGIGDKTAHMSAKMVGAGLI